VILNDGREQKEQILFAHFHSNFHLGLSLTLYWFSFQKLNVCPREFRAGGQCVMSENLWAQSLLACKRKKLKHFRRRYISASESYACNSKLLSTMRIKTQLYPKMVLLYLNAASCGDTVRTQSIWEANFPNSNQNFNTWLDEKHQAFFIE